MEIQQPYLPLAQTYVVCCFLSEPIFPEGQKNGGGDINTISMCGGEVLITALSTRTANATSK